MTLPADITIFSPAKINLALHVTGKRDDGYHLLDSLVAFASIGDEISISQGDEFTFEITGAFADQLDAADDNNLIRQAAKALSKRFDLDLNLRVTLTKNLPVSSGMGGGSGNAAATIYGLEQYYNLDIPTKQRDDMLLSLGADVPVCYHGIRSGKLVRMQAIGDVLTPHPSAQFMPCLIINPDQACGTADVFQGLSAADYSGALPSLAGDADIIELIKNTHNDLSHSASKIIPDIQIARDEMAVIPHCEVARMTGSGATVFGIFTDIKHAQNAANIMQAKHPSWWIKPCFLNAPKTQ